jgi:flagellar motor protein MotB
MAHLQSLSVKEKANLAESGQNDVNDAMLRGGAVEHFQTEKTAKPACLHPHISCSFLYRHHPPQPCRPEQALSMLSRVSSPCTTASSSIFINHISVVDLIRHGKNHAQTQPARQHDDQQYQYTSQQQQQQAAHHHHQPQQQQAREKTREQQHQQTQKTHAYQQELEQIVQEEREAKETMPTYKGLEQYKLVEKMGECVVDSHYLPSQALTHRASVAHSQTSTRRSIYVQVKRLRVCFVYLLYQTSSSAIATVKIVRKYELSASQVSSLSFQATVLIHPLSFFTRGRLEINI